METVDKLRLQIYIEKGYSLMRIFNPINTDVQSNIFIYEGVRSWRERDQFTIQRGETIVGAGDMLNYEEFRRMVGVSRWVYSVGSAFGKVNLYQIYQDCNR
jgi:uncharacterized protein involved in tellurium resistance